MYAMYPLVQSVRRLLGIEVRPCEVTCGGMGSVFKKWFGRIWSGNGLGMEETKHQYLRVHLRHDCLKTIKILS